MWRWIAVPSASELTSQSVLSVLSVLSVTERLAFRRPEIARLESAGVDYQLLEDHGRVGHPELEGVSPRGADRMGGGREVDVLRGDPLPLPVHRGVAGPARRRDVDDPQGAVIDGDGVLQPVRREDVG